jgi:hypothetical protein
VSNNLKRKNPISIANGIFDFLYPFLIYSSFEHVRNTRSLYTCAISVPKKFKIGEITLFAGEITGNGG